MQKSHPNLTRVTLQRRPPKAAEMPKARHLMRAASMGLLSSVFAYFAYGQLIRLTIAIFSCILATCFYRLTLHPLSGVPGPRLAALSNIWYAYHVRNGLVAQLATTLHQQYGPVVRVGPNEVWFNSKAAFKAIYSKLNTLDCTSLYSADHRQVMAAGLRSLIFTVSRRSFPELKQGLTSRTVATTLTKLRLDWRLQPHSEDTLDLLSERNTKRYRLQRRLIGPAYRPSNVCKYESAVDSALRRAVVKLRELDGSEVDLKEWMHMIVVECLGAAVLSWSPGMISHGTDWGTSKHSYLGWRRKSVLGLFPLAVKAEIYSQTFSRAFSTLWGLTYKTPPNFRTFFPVCYYHCCTTLPRLKTNMMDTGRGEACRKEAQICASTTTRRRSSSRPHSSSSGEARVQPTISAQDDSHQLWRRT